MKQLAYSALLAATFLTGASAQTTDLGEADIAALRYFLSINDQASVAAELRRLRKLFPNADVQSVVDELSDNRVSIDERPMWEALNADDYDGLRTQIREAQAKEPTWAPPEEMMTILRDRETQGQLEQAIDTGNLGLALTVIQTNPALTACEYINNPWRIAELFVKAGQPASARSIYQSILSTCTDPDYVVATLQKASGFSDEAQMTELFALARAGVPTMHDRLDALEKDLMAGIDARLNPNKPQAAPKPSGGSSVIAQAGAAASRSDWARCLKLLSNPTTRAMHVQRSWCSLNYGRQMDALNGFQRAASGNDRLAREAQYGLILTYAQLGQPKKAEQIMNTAQLTKQQLATSRKAVYSGLAVSSFERKRYTDAIRYLEKLENHTKLDRGQLMMRGWSYYHTGRSGRAMQQFRSVQKFAPGPDSLQAIARVALQ